MNQRNSLLNIASNLLKEGKKIRITARGYSMYPAIKPGYIVYLESCKNWHNVDIGDIIAIKQDENIILHRVIYIFESNKKPYFMTRGDASLSSDSPVQFNQIVGKAILIESGKSRWKSMPGKFIPEWKYLFNKRKVWIILKFRKLFKILCNG